MFFERCPVGCSNSALRWQNTGGWAARNTFGADKLGNRRFSIVRRGDGFRTDWNFQGPM